MSKSRMILVGLNLLLMFGFIVVVYHISHQTEGESNAPFLVKTPKFTGVLWDDHRNCKQCHSTIYQEWENSMHGIAWTDPHVQLLKDRQSSQASHFGSECQACHTPAPVFERSDGEFVKGRTWDLSSGVNCLTCHKQGNAVVGSGITSNTPCNAISNSYIGTAEYCGDCHRAVDKSRSVHEYEEWLERSELTRNKTCLDCHMEAVERPIADGGPVRTGHSHWDYVSKNPKFLRTAFDIRHELLPGKVKVGIVNLGTGHKMPTGRMRTMYLDVLIHDTSNAVVKSHREIFAKPAVAGVGKSTQILDGETRVFEYPLEGLGKGHVEVNVYFKAMRYDLDEDLEPIFTQTIPFPEKK